MAYARIQHRRDAAAAWEEVNPVLAHGEIGLITDSLGQGPVSFKIGDGDTPWNELPLASFEGGGAGLPSGGTIGQVLRKKSGASGDVGWGNQSGDKYTVGAYDWCDMYVEENGTLGIEVIPLTGKDILFCSDMRLTVPQGMNFTSPFGIFSRYGVSVELHIPAATNIALRTINDMTATITGEGRLHIIGPAFRNRLTHKGSSIFSCDELYDGFNIIEEAAIFEANYLFNTQIDVRADSAGSIVVGTMENTWFYDLENSETLLFCNNFLSCSLEIKYESDAQDEGLIELDAREKIIIRESTFKLYRTPTPDGIRRALFKINQNGSGQLDVQFIRNIVSHHVYSGKDNTTSINMLACYDADSDSVLRFVLDGNRIAFGSDDATLVLPFLNMKDNDYDHAPAVNYAAILDNTFVLNIATDRNSEYAPAILLVKTIGTQASLIQANRNRLYAPTECYYLIAQPDSGRVAYAQTADENSFLVESGNYWIQRDAGSCDNIQDMWN